MKKKITVVCFFLFTVGLFSQPVTDSITRKPPLRGKFRWILSEDLYEEGNIHNNLKTGEWKKYYQGAMSGKTVYREGLAVSEYWNYKDSLKLRYNLSSALDSMTIYDYDMEGRIVKIIKHTVDPKTFFLNYSLMTEDTLFRKVPVTEINYLYELWAHRGDMMVVTETTAGIVNKKYFVAANSGKTAWKLWFEINDKGDFLVGKRKEFTREEEKSKKFLEEKEKKASN